MLHPCAPLEAVPDHKGCDGGPKGKCPKGLKRTVQHREAESACSWEPFNKSEGLGAGGEGRGWGGGGGGAAGEGQGSKGPLGGQLSGSLSCRLLPPLSSP